MTKKIVVLCYFFFTIMEWITEENSNLVSFFLSGKKKIFFLCVFKDVKVWYEKKYLVRNVKKNNLIFYMMKKNSILKIFCFFSWKKKYAQTQNFTRKLAFVLNFFLLLAYWDSNKKISMKKIVVAHLFLHQTLTFLLLFFCTKEIRFSFELNSIQ